MTRSPDRTELFAKALRHHQAGDIAQAVALYRQILAAEPSHLAAAVNLGGALVSLGAFAEAQATLERAVFAAPDSAQAHNNLGHALERQGKIDAAIASYRKALMLDPAYADASFNLGNAFMRLERLDEAVAAFGRTLQIKPDHIDAIFNLGNVHLHRGDLDAAISCYRRVLAAKPQFAVAHRNLATAFSRHDRVTDAFASFSRYAALMGRGASPGASPHLAQHDAEQQAHLTDAGISPHDFHLGDGGRLAGPAVNPMNVAEAAEKWQQSQPKIAVVDGFLTAPALEKLRRFCWESTVWRRPHPDGYIGALPEDGLACPLLAQIAEELHTAFPAILGKHRFRRLAGFKYDCRGAGLNLHADNAAVNINFWITDDNANLDPQSGGLIVWDVPAPVDWPPGKFNGDAGGCREFLARTGASAVTIPYRANRAVIFDSDLFHETDRFTFRDDYRSRRISISMLYGERGD